MFAEIFLVVAHSRADPLEKCASDAPTCEDHAADCTLWAGQGECTRNELYMKVQCAKSCESCGWSPPGRVLSEGRAAPECEDKHSNKHCAAWARDGQCNANAGFMKVECASSCGSCGWAAAEQATRCRRRRNATRAVQPGGVNAMFERAVADSSLRATVWSRDPWVVTFADFVREDERHALLETSEGRYARSLAGDVVSPVRTSEQTWCQEARCVNHTAVRLLQERVVGVTGVPIENSEFFQVVKYDVGQFYRAHHDQNTRSDSLSGVRLFTFFMYLVEPAAGGETRFPKLGITVPPTRGTALLWANTRDHDPHAEDPRTTHEALPPIEGVKYAANLWLHQYDFRTPNTNGCDLDARVEELSV